jgi:trigger factor
MAEFQLEKTGPCSRKLAVTIPADRIQAAIAVGWRNAQQSISLKGFRPGKVPRSLIEKKFGDEIRKEIKQQLVNEAFQEAVEQHSLSPVSSPNLDLHALELDPQQDLRFELAFEVRPEFELQDYKGVEVEVPKVAFGEEDVEREVEMLRARFATPQPVAEGGAAEGDYLKAKLEIVVDGAVVKEVADAVIDPRGDTIDGIPVEGGTKQFLGKGAGDRLEVPAKWPAGYAPEGHAGAEALLRCEVLEVTRFVSPPLDEVVTKIGLESAEDLRTRIRDEIGRTVEGRRNQFIEEKVLDALIASHVFDVPGKLLDQMTDQTLHRMAHERAHQQGLDHEAAHHEVEPHRAEARAHGERRLRIGFLIEKIAAAEQVAISEQDLESAVRALAASQRRDPQQVADEIIANKGVPALRAQIAEAKVRRLLREHAKVAEIQPTEQAK